MKDTLGTLRARIAALGDTWTDEQGTVHERPTAWAYAQSCAALDRWRKRAEELEAQLAEKEAEVEQLKAPPATEEWQTLIRLAYADGGDGVLRINRITAEYNRARQRAKDAENIQHAEKKILIAEIETSTALRKRAEAAEAALRELIPRIDELMRVAVDETMYCLISPELDAARVVIEGSKGDAK